jgi:hypothetical protein
MRHIKPYQIFEASAAAPEELTAEQIDWLNECTSGSWELNTSTGLVDVKGNFNCNSQNLEDLKGVKFGTVGGDFSCANNQLTTLEGAPQSVGASFFCYGNRLTTLEGAPQSVGGFFCNGNQLTTLKGAPQTTRGYFNCYDNRLTTLEGAPQSVGGVFACDKNQITSLEGAPQESRWGSSLDFSCSDNPVSEKTLKAIFELMLKGMRYQQALEEYWPNMGEEDRSVMYKQMPDLPPEDARKYKALATYAKIKGYL